MDLEQKIGQRLMIGIRGTSLDKETRSHLKEISPGGVILFSRNISHRDQVRTLINEIKEAVQPSPLIAVDQEGGLVVRFFREVTVMPGNMALGAVNSPELAFKQGRVMAQELKSIGFDINLAPVVDVVTTYDNPGITIRSFGSDPRKVAALGVNFIQGIQSNGIGAVAKHFPGKGAASKDAHSDLPVVNLSWGEMVRDHLRPFEKCVRSGVQGIMSSHVIYPNLPGAPDVPATFASKLINGHLRQDMGFEGVIFSDDLEMGAITKFFPFEEAVVNTARAGHDMLLVCKDYEKQDFAFHSLYKACEENKQTLEETDKAVERIDTLRRFCQTGEYEKEITEIDASLLAQEIAEKSMTLLGGDMRISLSLETTIKIFAVIPDLARLESIETGFEMGENNFILRMLRERAGESVQTFFVDLEPSEEEVRRVGEKAQSADLVLAFIFNARYIKGQHLLLEKLKAFPQKTVFILIRNPFDLEFLKPDMITLITYGYRKVQIEAAIKILKGDIPALGKLPFLQIHEYTK